MQRNLSYEAHLWYTITSPDYVQRAKGYLQDAHDFLLSQMGREPLATEYPPLIHWASEIQHLIDTFDNEMAVLRQGEYGAMLGWGGRLERVPRGFDESVQWMSNEDYRTFKRKLNLAVSICSDFDFALSMSRMYSSQGYKDGTKDWHYCVPEDMGIVSNNIALNYEEHIFPTPPAELPEYAPDTSVTCKTGDIVPWTGVWVPTTGMGTAALVFARKHVQIMQPSYEVAYYDEDLEMVTKFNLVDTTFHPVKPTGRMLPWPQPVTATEHLERLRCEADQPCPRTGWWWSPAAGGQGRQHFEQGQILPKIESDYGATIWYWEADQQD
ncbi:hypothetical protein [Chitinivorax sp. B]|uniref:hypothetical protein n=1 Tax=Chitinivorax sp. B TaxID=2502235 RepID=UPI0010F9D461|nr:hypothetical protein [Chitinivorax sp. B]